MEQLKHINDNTLCEYRSYITKIKGVNNLSQGIHGINHLLRVLLFALLICDELKVFEKNRTIVATAALYHDIGRKNDDSDVIHGLLSWRKAKDYIDEGFLENDINIIKYIIENHCVPDKIAFENVKAYNISDKAIANKLLNIVKDADSLDIIRLGFFEVDYLRYESSKGLINIAKHVNRLNDRILKL